MKRLQDAARGDDSVDTAYASLADKIADVASSRELILVSPLLPDEGNWFRMFAFAADAPVMTTLIVNLGPEIPSSSDQELMVTHLRKHFGAVQAFDSMKMMALVARGAWPSPRADEFLESVNTGPGFRDFSE
jgi:hypothetical protein